ncbi:MAG: HD domain-containing protein [bacterium]|nr:HD domain-containing protein [bacterium]
MAQKVAKKSLLVYSPAAQKLIELAIEQKLLHLLRAVQLAIHSYAGEKRKNGQDEVDHSVAVVWILWRWGIKKDEYLAAAMLHDLIESEKETLEFIKIWFNDEIAEYVDCLTKRPDEKCDLVYEKQKEIFGFMNAYHYRMDKDWSQRFFLSDNRLELKKRLPKSYKLRRGQCYDRIGKHVICIIIKLADKISIFGNMSYSLPIGNQVMQIADYEVFLSPLCKQVRKTKKKYLEAMFAGRDEIEGLIKNVLYQIYLKVSLEQYRKELAEHNKSDEALI